MNFLQKKIREVNELITNKIDICLIPETKLDQPFPNQQFQIHGFKMFCRGRGKYSAVNKTIPSNVLIHT